MATEKKPILTAQMKPTFCTLGKGKVYSLAEIATKLQISKRTLVNYFQKDYLGKDRPASEIHSKVFPLFST